MAWYAQAPSHFPEPFAYIIFSPHISVYHPVHGTQSLSNSFWLQRFGVMSQPGTFPLLR